MKGSPFCIQTNLGRLELTKGAFLTLQRRYSLALHTARKDKRIARDHKATVRKHKEEGKCSRYRQIRLVSRQGRNIRFAVAGESERLRWKDCTSLPTKEIVCDNDDESEWVEIEDCITNLSLSLSLAAFDNRTRL